jgi:hypothetical protein
MPGFDRSGPMGDGPMTGGGFGRCSGMNVPAGGFGRGMGRGRNCARRGGTFSQFGRGRGFGFAAGPAREPGSLAENEVNYLKAEAQQLERYLQSLNKQISDLETQPE